MNRRDFFKRATGAAVAAAVAKVAAPEAMPIPPNRQYASSIPFRFDHRVGARRYVEIQQRYSDVLSERRRDLAFFAGEVWDER